MSLNLDSTIQASDQHVASDLADEVVILDLQSGVYYGLDPVGTRIWQLIQEPTRLADVKKQLLEEYDVAPDQCEQDLLQLTQRLVDEGLIRIHTPSPA